MLNLGLPSGVVVTPITSQEESRWLNPLPVALSVWSLHVRLSGHTRKTSN